MNLDELERLHKHVNKDWHAAKTGEIGHLYSALNQAFPALLALARDGERYRWAHEQGLAWRGCYGPHWAEGEWLYAEQGSELLDAARKGEKP